MSFLLVPGAGGSAWYWHLVLHLLDDAAAVTLPAADDSAGLAEYADAIVAAGRQLTDITLVAQSMGGFSAPLAVDRLDVRRIVLVNAMVPKPGETAGDWWATTGQGEASRAQAEADRRTVSAEFDLGEAFFHDVPEHVTREAFGRDDHAQSDRPFADPWPLAAWPDVPTRVVAGRDDRFFPPDFQRHVAKERLGLDVEEIPGGHLVALSQPAALAETLRE
jgi:pimeloyl-ACP methyl ester carboxylesterase